MQTKLNAMEQHQSETAYVRQGLWYGLGTQSPYYGSGYYQDSTRTSVSNGPLRLWRSDSADVSQIVEKCSISQCWRIVRKIPRSRPELQEVDAFQNLISFPMGTGTSTVAALGERGRTLNTIQHRRSQGVHWAHVHPPGRRKFFSGPYLQGKVVSAPPDGECNPEAEQESNFLRKLWRCRRWERLFR